MPPTIQLKRLHSDAAVPRRATAGSFGYDLATLREERIGPRETTILPCGFKLAADLPHDETGGFAFLVFPRSSLPLKYGLILPNSPGLIDADYAEEIGIIVHNLRDEEVRLDTGTRIAQAVFVRLEFPNLEVAERDDQNRTRGGFGSTGD
ncbi:MAG: dUTP diphosphatase [Gemmatimonadales bacterium]|jgi:dUTP pyrophosphatase